LPPDEREGWVLADPGVVFGVTTGLVYAPPDDFSYNSSYGSNEVMDLGAGRYLVAMPGLGGLDGNVQVTAFGETANRCNVVDWTGMPDLMVEVQCWSPEGSPAESLFVVYFRQSAQHTSDIYAAAHVAVSDGGEIDPFLSHNSSGETNDVEKVGVGHYEISMPGLTEPGSTGNVTAWGRSANFCKLAGVAEGTSDARAVVLCFDPSGTPADTAFSFRYLRRAPSIVGGQTLSGYLHALPSASSTQSFNTTGAVNSGSGAAGSYEAVYPRLPLSSSTVLVTANGLGPAYCNVADWDATASAATVATHCFLAGGDPVDTNYYQSYLTDAVYIPSLELRP
jgi:hypothetical protein